MRANLSLLFTALAAAALIAGCGTTPEDQQASGAPVIDPTTGKPTTRGKISHSVDGATPHDAAIDDSESRSR